MNSRRTLMFLMMTAIAANAVLLVDSLTTGVLVPRVEAREPAATPAASAPPAAAAKPQPAAATVPAAPADTIEQTYLDLVAQLTAHNETLTRKEQELAERERQFAVLRQELLAEKANAPAAGAAAKSAAFDKLLKAYEGMDPANAAAAMAELYNKDRGVTVDVLLGLKARQSGAILDALAETSPTIAAELSLEVWKRDPRGPSR